MHKQLIQRLQLFEKIVQWFRVSKRALPWRMTMEPYHQLVAEYIFQQTRIEQGMNYYLKIIDKYPTIEALAHTTEQEFLKDWQGLGYYGRAHRLLELAREIVTNYQSRFPVSREELLKLPGIGPYTSAILASQWSGEKVPAIDGNVKRVMSRLFAISIPIEDGAFANKIEHVLRQAIQYFQAGEFNEALMEFGALVCLPRQPSCNICPVSSFCKAFSMGKVMSFPVKRAKKNKPLEEIFYVVKQDDQKNFYMKVRHQSLWKGLYEFPFLIYATDVFSLKKHAIFIVKHELTHRKIVAYFLKDYPIEIDSSFEKISIEKIFNLPVHRVIDKFLKSQIFRTLFLVNSTYRSNSIF